MLTACAIALALFGQVQIEPESLNRTFVGQRIVLEDLCTSVLGEGDKEHFRLKRCNDVKFYPDGVAIDRIRGLNLEVTGTVELRDDSLVVKVDSLKRLPDDLTRYSQRVETIAPNDYQSWYTLADWALKRGETYRSDAMLEKSAIAYRTAVATQRALASGIPARLEAVRDKIAAQDPRLGAYDLNGLEHEILRARYQQMTSTSPADLRQFVGNIKEKLGGGPELAPLSEIRREQYDKEPAASYSRADEADRKRLSRYWQASILHRALRQEARGNQLDSSQLADLAVAQFPDYPDLLKKWNDDALASLRQDPLAFQAHQVTELVQKASEAEAKVLMAQWLKAKERQLQSDEAAAAQQARAKGVASLRDAKSRFDLAELYGQWLPNEPSTPSNRVRLYQETMEIDPQFMEASVKLRELGAKQERVFTRRDNVGPLFRIGMKADEIEVLPDFRTKVVTNAGIHQQWVYRGIGGAKSTYLFLSPRAGNVLTVTDVHEK